MKSSAKSGSLSYFVIPGLASPQLTRLIYTVSRCTGVAVAAMRSEDRRREVATARHLFAFVARNQFGTTYQHLADFLNRSSHSTIKKSEEQASNFLQTDAGFRGLYDQVMAALGQETGEG